MDQRDINSQQPQWQFDHHRLDASHVAKEAMVRSDQIARSLGLTSADAADAALALLWRLCAMLTRLSGIR